MGRIVNVKCPGCGYESTLSLGAGAAAPELNDAISGFRENIAKEIKQWSKTNPYTIFETDTAIGHCEKCGSVEEMRVITFYNSGKKTEFEDVCTICHEKLRRVDYPGGEAPCPRCKTALICNTVGFWD